MEGTPPQNETALIDASAVAVLDASSLLAVVFGEPGSDRVKQAIRRGSLVGMVNWAEALSRMAEEGESIQTAVHQLKTQMNALGSLTVIPFEEVLAIEAARLRVPTRHLGLSLADRACLALGRLRRLPVLTTDRAWRSLRISVKIEVIR
jgi:ribonuclease VapC